MPSHKIVSSALYKHSIGWSYLVNLLHCHKNTIHTAITTTTARCITDLYSRITTTQANFLKNKKTNLGFVAAELFYNPDALIFPGQ